MCNMKHIYWDCTGTSFPENQHNQEVLTANPATESRDTRSRFIKSSSDVLNIVLKTCTGKATCQELSTFFMYYSD